MPCPDISNHQQFHITAATKEFRQYNQRIRVETSDTTPTIFVYSVCMYIYILAVCIDYCLVSAFKS